MAEFLVIDDDAQLRAALRRMLEEAGHGVVEAEDGLSGLSLIGTRPFAAALVDLFMPGIDGLELVPKLKVQAPGTRVVVMSGGIGGRALDLLRAAERAGADARLVKPFTREELFAALGDAPR